MADPIDPSSLTISRHASLRLAQRNIRPIRLFWCIEGGSPVIQADGRRLYTRVYDHGRSIMHVILSPDGTTLITAWVRGRLDVGR